MTWYDFKHTGNYMFLFIVYTTLCSQTTMIVTHKHWRFWQARMASSLCYNNKIKRCLIPHTNRTQSFTFSASVGRRHEMDTECNKNWYFINHVIIFFLFFSESDFKIFILYIFESVIVFSEILISKGLA